MPAWLRIVEYVLLLAAVAVMYAATHSFWLQYLTVFAALFGLSPLLRLRFGRPRSESSPDPKRAPWWFFFLTFGPPIAALIAFQKVVGRHFGMGPMFWMLLAFGICFLNAHGLAYLWERRSGRQRREGTRQD